MKPIKFKHVNTEFAKDQEQYNTLPALRLDTPEGHVITCWKMTPKERLKVLFTGKVWMNLMSFNKPLTPSLLSTDRKDMYSHIDDEKGFWSKVKRSLNL